MTQDEAKQAVAQRALDFVEDGMRLGLGTGTTATMFIRALGERVRQGLAVECVASSDASEELARSLGIRVTSLAELPQLDMYVDGADEVGPGLALIKGGGGALLREKIVASAARRFIVVVDSSKIVPALGCFPLPIEVVKMALPLVVARLQELGLAPQQRMRGDEPYRTDEGNFIVDCRGGELADPVRTAAEVRAIVGVVEHGLFLNMASLVLVAGDEGVLEKRE